MIEAYGDLWTYPAHVRCITTNGYVKANGKAVMGRGCALQAANRYPWLPGVLGEELRHGRGNHVVCLDTIDGWDLWAFPVKHIWNQKANIALIARSAKEITAALKPYPNLVVVIPRPGCGNGELDWVQVGPILAPILDDRFHVITYAGD